MEFVFYPANSYNTASEISGFIRILTVMNFWVRDQVSHKEHNEMENLAKETHNKHLFVTAHSLWGNSQVGRCMRIFLDTHEALSANLCWPLKIFRVFSPWRKQ